MNANICISINTLKDLPISKIKEHHNSLINPTHLIRENQDNIQQDRSVNNVAPHPSFKQQNSTHLEGITIPSIPSDNSREFITLFDPSATDALIPADLLLCVQRSVSTMNDNSGIEINAEDFL